MAVLISGKLIGPNGDPRPGVTIMLTVVKTSSAVAHLTPSSSTTGPEEFVPSKPGDHRSVIDRIYIYQRWLLYGKVNRNVKSQS
ncbi:hypothetical protein CEQ31_000975 [Serratia odorifera]|jgi:hypothetical protein|nr:hypothetical protein CEQ31_026260 [Serratia odorifera]PNK88258.1 hypothetical protein CEQ31_000250 [Serratia odorifera]PNK88380.1 hypothetical protein CEQ31_000975 [Serratia odorifera]RII74083.1 hypothetical protein DX901_00345 [Serratia odorifera]